MVGSSGTRVSPRLHVADKHSDRNDNCSTITTSYDLNSEHIRRYIIEDVMFLKCTDRIVILIGENNNNLEYWTDISSKQNNGIDRVVIDNNPFMQIRASVLNSFRREAFVNGKMDHDEINYHILGVGFGGAAISISFDECCSSASIELKFSQVLDDEDFQVWVLCQ